LAILAAQTTETQEFISLLHGECGDLLVVREINKQGNVNEFFTRLHTALQYIPPQDANVYIGMFAHRGKPATAETTTTTGALWADFDDTNDAAEVEARIRSAGLPQPSLTVNSGHGIHTYWLLDKRAQAGDVVPVLKALAVALGSDGSVCDAARIMRVPGSINHKDSPAVPCSILSVSPLRYNLNDLRKTLTNHLQPVRDLRLQGVRSLLESDFACLRAMANGVRQGHRNTCLGRITAYLKLCDFDESRAWAEVMQWNSLCSPPENLRVLRTSFESYWARDYKLLGCVQENPVLQAVLSDYCAGAECRRKWLMADINFGGAIAYSNREISDLANWTGQELILYGVLLKSEKGMTTSQLQEALTSPATGKPCMHSRLMMKCLKELRARGLAKTVRRNRHTGSEDFHRAENVKNWLTRYTLVSKGALLGAIDGRVSPAQFRVYVLLCRFAWRKRRKSKNELSGACFPSRVTLQKELEIKYGASVTAHLRALERAGYISRSYGRDGNPYKLNIKLEV
jgi:hypothetical protein